MFPLWTVLVVLLLNNVVGLAQMSKRDYNTHDYYVVEHDSQLLNGASLADVVQALGVEVVSRAGELPDHWIVRKSKPQPVPGQEPVDRLLEAFEGLRKQANSPISARSDEINHARRVASAILFMERQSLRRRVKRAPPPQRPPTPPSSSSVAARFGIHDPLFPDQWHLINEEFAEHMMNVTPVWEMGITGKGVISSLVDDGLDYGSEDLAENFDADNSYDFNDHEALPTPKNFDDHHGTRCAGQVAAGNNTACGIGIAFESKVAGVRILSGPISDVDEAAALNYGYQNVSIYSCSWGPPDNGQSMEGPGYLIKKAVVNGINNGRGGKGSIFVFASGNGAANGDQCNFDGYTNSIYSVTVSAIDYKGLHPYYSESCAANMIVAYSSGSGKHIVTTDKGKNECAQTHGGTSAAAPNAVGVFALALQARPDLTWRDVQYLCIETARMINPEDSDWEKTASGRHFSYKYGFGVLDAGLYVHAAKTWKLVKSQAWLTTNTIQIEGGAMSSPRNYSGGALIGPGGVNSTLTVTKQMLIDNNFESLEHINIKVWINHTRRGDVEVEIFSPQNIRSILATKRHADSASTGYPGWTFMSVKHWGEDPVGDWTIRVRDQQTDENHGRFLGWNMMLWGSSVDPTKARKYEVPHVEDILPPKGPARPIVPSATSTTNLVKPTTNLPGDHSVVVGEKTSVLSTPTAISAVPTGNTTFSNPTADQGWFPDMSTLVTNQKWFFVAIGAVAIFGLGAGAYFWRRRIAGLSAGSYSALAGGEEMSMTAGGLTGGPRTTRELYDAFGEVSDDEEDETTALRPAHGRPTAGLGFHSGFLDDDEPSASLTPTYHDEPEHGQLPSQEERNIPQERAVSPNGSGESWEHASA